VTVVGVIARSDLQDAAAVLGELVDWLKARGAGCRLDEGTASLLGRASAGLDVTTGEELGRSVDALVVLGGDGTLLAASHLVSREETLLLGVNFGSLGFLTEIGLAELYITLDGVLSGQCRYEERRMLSAHVRRNRGDTDRTDVLNDVVVTKASLSRIIELDVSIDGAFVSAFRADGLIISSPTGSTAYNLAAGGPILHPALPAVVVTPICPHMLTNRPLVVSDASHIEVRLREGRDVAVHVSFDGQSGVAIGTDDTLVVSRSPRALRLVKSGERDYYDVLRAKLKWGDSAVRRS
jgi:NAD+ kinase